VRRPRIRSVQFPYQKRASLLTPGELAFYRVLRQVVRNRYGIALKTRLADVLKCPDELWDAPQGRRLSQKHVDFVLYDLWTARVIAAVELDDRSHLEPARRRRDAFVEGAFRAAGVALFRVPAAAWYDVGALWASLASCIHHLA